MSAASLFGKRACGKVRFITSCRGGSPSAASFSMSRLSMQLVDGPPSVDVVFDCGSPLIRSYLQFCIVLPPIALL